MEKYFYGKERSIGLTERCSYKKRPMIGSTACKECKENVAFNAYEGYIICKVIEKAVPEKFEKKEKLNIVKKDGKRFFDVTIIINEENEFEVIDNSQHDWRDFVDGGTKALKEVIIKL
jgi:hypothetical protein